MVNINGFGEKEEIILKAAMEVFIEKGYHGTKMQEIADRAGTNKALLHYYFRNKERLYSQIFEMVLKKFITVLSNVFGQDLSIEEILQRFIDGFIETIKENPRVPMFLAHELSQGGKTVSRTFSSVLQQLPDSGPWKLLDLLKKAQLEGQIDPFVDPRQFLLTLIGSCVYFFFAEPIVNSILIGQKEFDRDQFLEDRKKAIYNTLLFGIKKHGDAKP